MTLYLRKHSPQYKSEEEMINVYGEGETVEECIEALRGHFLHGNQRIVELSKNNSVPDCILKLAHSSIERNSDLDITINEDGIVYVDGIGPEMDYYTIRA